MMTGGFVADYTTRFGRVRLRDSLELLFCVRGDAVNCD